MAVLRRSVPLPELIYLLSQELFVTTFVPPDVGM